MFDNRYRSIIGHYTGGHLIPNLVVIEEGTKCPLVYRQV